MTKKILIRLGLGVVAASLLAGALGWVWLSYAPRRVPAGQLALAEIG
jgi:hypothetical protein